MTSSQKKWTLRELLTWITSQFQAKNFSSPLLDAQLLMCRALNYQNRVELYLHSDKFLKEKELITLRKLVRRRLAHEPVAYILNQKYWYNLDLYIDKSVLIPRPETESLLDFVLETVKQKRINPKVIFDLATGSGCLAIALAKAFPEATVVAIDISSDALNLAKKNAKRNDVTNIEFSEANLLECTVFEQLKEKFGQADVIVANPPYVTEAEWQGLTDEVKNFEPKLALVAQDNGLEIGKSLCKHITGCELLAEKSIFGMELSHQQPALVLNKMSLNPANVLPINAQEHEKPIQKWFILKDLEEKERFLVKIYGTESALL